MSAVDDEAWFEDDGDLGEADRAFAAALRIRATSWPADPTSTRIDSPQLGHALIAWLDVDDPGSNLSLMTVGVHLKGSRLRGDKLHNQLFTLPEEPTSLALEASGNPQKLANRAADWFESILRRPVVRYEWLQAGTVYACRYLFSDTGEGLVQMYNHELAPPGQRDQLIAAGHTKGRGWIDTRGLGQPDRISYVRGDRP